MEIWRDIPGTDYQASTKGRLRVVRYMRLQRSKQGYLLAARRVGSRWVKLGAHRMVAEAFLGLPKQPGLQVNHKNGDKSDNRPENLEWVTPKENAGHAVRAGFYKRGREHYRAKLTPATIKFIKAEYKKGYHTMRTLGVKLGLSKATISRVVAGRHY